jgi:hypothetical protein
MKKLRAGAANAAQPIAKSRAAKKASPKSRANAVGEPSTFLASSRSDTPIVLSAPETERMWELQRLAERDPAAYIAACRAKAR